MPSWLSIAYGPLLRFALALLILGLLRLVILTILDIAMALRRAGEARLPYRTLASETLSWLLPFRRIHRSRRGYSYASFTMHLAILSSAFCLSNHLEILKSQTGLYWPALPRPLLDLLALAGIFAMSYLLLQRILARSSRQLSRGLDYSLLLLLLTLFLSGYLAGRPWNPVPYNSLMLFHTLIGGLLMIIIPFTKIAHCLLYPLIRLGSAVAWRFTPHGGGEAVQQLYGAEGRRI